MSSKHYGIQINALMHGSNSIGNFTLPQNIELITFNRPNFALDILHVIKIFDTLRKIKVSKRLKSQILLSDISDLYTKYKLNYGSNYDKVKKMNIRLTVYKPGAENVPNLVQTFQDESNKKKVIGFYNTINANISYKRFNEQNANMNVNNNIHNNGEFFPQSGFLQNSYEEFINNKLNGNKNLFFTTKQMIEYIGLEANKSFPGKVVRIFLLCCRSDVEQAIDEDMAEKYLQNISSETISPDIAEQPLLSASAVETISKKRKRVSSKISVGKTSSLKKTAKRSHFTGSFKTHTKKRKRSGFKPKTHKIRKSNIQLSHTQKKRKINGSSSNSNNSNNTNTK